MGSMDQGSHTNDWKSEDERLGSLERIVVTCGVKSVHLANPFLNIMIPKDVCPLFIILIAVVS